MGVEVGVGVKVGVLVGVGGRGVAVAGTDVGEGVGVGVGVEIRRGVGVECSEVTVSAPDPCTVAGRGRESMTSRATKTPATKLRAGTITQPFPATRPPMRCHQWNQ
jgi:hypothetical protein